MPGKSAKPSEIAITIAALGSADARLKDDAGWVAASEVRVRLQRLGFVCSVQQVASWLARMARTELPWVERRQIRFFNGGWEYRVTQYGVTDLHNRLPGVRPETPWLTVWRDSTR